MLNPSQISQQMQPQIPQLNEMRRIVADELKKLLQYEKTKVDMRVIKEEDCKMISKTSFKEGVPEPAEVNYPSSAKQLQKENEELKRKLRMSERRG